MDNSLIYRRLAEPVLGSTLSETQARTGVMGSFVQHFEEKEKQEDELNKLKYHNFASEVASKAYAECPNDLEGYKKSFRKQLDSYDIPFSQRHEYESIALKSEAHYYPTIIGNNDKLLKESKKNEVLSLADRTSNDGISAMLGVISQPDEHYVGDQFKRSLMALTACDDHGNTVLPPDVIAERLDKYGLNILTTMFNRELDGVDDPAIAANDYLSGKNYVVELNSSDGTITISSDDLSASAKKQFQSNIEKSVKRQVSVRAAQGKLEQGKHLIEYPATYRGTTEQRKCLDEWANGQIANVPLDADNETVHLDNLEYCVREFSYIPDPYVSMLSSGVNSKNGNLSVSSSRLLDAAIATGGGGISRQFSDDTLLKSQMINTLSLDGNDPKDIINIIDGVFSDPRSRDTAIALNNKLRGSINEKDRSKLFGDHVTAKEYGDDGLSMYEGLVKDYYIMNGGDIQSAQTVAKARLDSIYSYPTYGYYRKRRRLANLFRQEGRKMKYQPEAFYGEGIGRSIQEEMENDILPRLQKEFGYSDITAENYFFVADVATADAFHGSKNLPKWEIWYVKDNGNRIRVTNSSGDVIKYSVDYHPEKAADNKTLENKRIKEEKVRDFWKSYNEYSPTEEESQERLYQSKTDMSSLMDID